MSIEDLSEGLAVHRSGGGASVRCAGLVVQTESTWKSDQKETDSI